MICGERLEEWRELERRDVKGWVYRERRKAVISELRETNRVPSGEIVRWVDGKSKLWMVLRNDSLDRERMRIFWWFLAIRNGAFGTRARDWEWQ